MLECRAIGSKDPNFNMALEIKLRSSGVVTFPDLEGTTASFQGELTNRYLAVLDEVQAFYLLQKGKGFYPADLKHGEKMFEDALSPYTVVRRDGENNLISRKYTDIEPFNRRLAAISRRMQSAVDLTQTTLVTDANLIIDTLRPQVQAVKEGNFAGMMVNRLNSRLTPQLELLVVLLDRYLDVEYGAKLAMQGFLMERNDSLTSRFSEITQAIGIDSQKHRVVAVDALAFAGLATDRIWSGNTLPSEDDFRASLGSLNLIFINNMRARAEDEFKKPVLKYTPQVKEIPGWESRFPEAVEVNTLLHEIGHSQIEFDGQTVVDLGSNYVTFKEGLAEVHGREDIWRVPARLIDNDLKKLAIARSFAHWRGLIDAYEAETEPVKKAVLRAYAEPGEWFLNYHERRPFAERGLKVNHDNGVIQILDWDYVKRGDIALLAAIYEAVRNERDLNGAVKYFRGINSHPVKYMRRCNPHSGNPQSQKSFLAQQAS